MSERAIKVIRLGFEPKTHSLEGCCSIQLSYRTDPYFASDFMGMTSKEGAKLMIIFGFAILKLIFRILFGREFAGESGGVWIEHIVRTPEQE